MTLLYDPFNFTHKANTFSRYTICRYSGSLIETQNNTTLSNVMQVRRNAHVNVNAHFITLLTVQKYLSGGSTFTMSFGYTVADLQHLYFGVFNASVILKSFSTVEMTEVNNNLMRHVFQ